MSILFKFQELRTKFWQWENFPSVEEMERYFIRRSHATGRVYKVVEFHRSKQFDVFPIIDGAAILDHFGQTLTLYRVPDSPALPVPLAIKIIDDETIFENLEKSLLQS